MKGICFIISFSLALLTSINIANATVHIVEARGTTIPTDIYVPDTVYAEVGDTITWIWIDGEHTTEFLDIPAGAAEWAAALDNNNTTFSYVVTEVGTYDYTCHKFFRHGMDGTIEVAEKTVTGIASVDRELVSSSYPNPFSDKITIETPPAEWIAVYNIVGQKVKSVNINNGQTMVEIDTTELTDGIYFYSIIKEGVIIATGKLVRK